jgi:lipopolysaccharide/colanic/teichoic acid biosynthesis glycosyltransferase
VTVAARLERALDVAVSLVGLVATAPLVGLAALAMARRDPGPILYRDEREGRDGRVFHLLKLRTMVVDGDHLLDELLATDPAAREEWFRFFRLERDPRIASSAARWVRKLSIDEIPQLLNVLRGDMTLVGPRPLPRSILDTFDPEFVALRRTVRPGLTGLWQVAGRSDLDMAGLEALDRRYLAAPSFGGDLRILVRTPAAVLAGTGAY